MALSAERRMLPNFGLSGFEVSSVCKGGWKITDLWNQIDKVTDKSPEVIFVQMGGNDLTSDRDALKVADDLLNMSRHLQMATGARHVFIGKLFYREAGPHLHKAQVNKYNLKVRQVNHYLRVMTTEIREVTFWRHSGIELLNTQLTGPDGTHLTDRGMHKFYRSIRGAMLFSRKQ